MLLNNRLLWSVNGGEKEIEREWSPGEGRNFFDLFFIHSITLRFYPCNSLVNGDF